MAATGYTPIILLNSTTSGNTPTTSNLAVGELAINIADGKLFFNQSGTIKVLANATYATSVSTISFGTTGLTPSTATNGVVTVAGTLVTTNGGTGLSTYTAGDLPYYASGTALSKLGIGSSGQILTSTGSAPQWSTLSGVAVTTFSAGTTGFTPSTATSGAITLSGTLATTNGGTGLTSFTANGVVYASSTSALATGSALTWNGTSLVVNQDSPSASYTVDVGGSIRLNASGADTQVAIRSANGYANFLYYGEAGVADRWVVGNSGGSGDLAWRQGAYSMSTGSEKMRLTSAGYLGIGTSSPIYILDAVGGNYGLDIFGSNNGANYLSLRRNFAPTSSGGVGFKCLNLGSGNYDGLGMYANQGLAFYSSQTEAMRINSSGNVGIGTTSPEANAKLTVYGAGIAISRDSSTVTPSGYDLKIRSANPKLGIHVTNNAQTATLEFGTANDNASGAFIVTTGTDPLRFGTNGTEAMRIDSSGNLLVGTTSGSAKFNISYSYPTTGAAWTSNTTSSHYAITFNNANGLVGSITTSGSTTTYNITSDQRLKTNIVDAPDGNIDQIKIRSFDWKSDGSHNTYGVIAQELLEVAPYAVHQPANTDEMMAVDYSKLVPMMIKEIQSLKQRIATLESK